MILLIVVLILKGNGKYHGISLEEIFWKVIETTMNERMSVKNSMIASMVSYLAKTAELPVWR